MKQAMINYIQNEKNDELYTPLNAIIPLLKYLPDDKKSQYGNALIMEKVILQKF